MARSIRSVLLETTHLHRLTAVGLVGFVGTFLAYATGLVRVSGGVVFIPLHAAVVGMLAAAWVGYRRDGLVVGWLLTYAALLGYRADHAFLGIAHRSLGHRIGYFLRPDGLAAFAVEAVVLGTLAFGVGYALRSVHVMVRDRRALPADR